MRTFKLFGALAVVFSLLLSFTTATASTAVSAKEARKEILKKVVDQHGDVVLEKTANSKMVKKAMRMAKFFGKNKAGDKVDFETEPDKWMWFWLAGWAAGVVFIMMGWFFWPASYLGYLCWLAGSVCLVIWLLKKTGNM